PYILGSGVTTVRTDNSALCSLMKKRDATLTGRLAQYQLALQQYDLDIVHRSGSSNRFCDYLSRYPGEQAQQADSEAKQEQDLAAAVEDMELRITPARIRHEQAIDLELQAIFKAVVNSKWPRDAREKRELEQK
ncbi:hypothetical protein AAVH_40777, partial [Aphelenchoides avenae]